MAVANPGEEQALDGPVAGGTVPTGPTPTEAIPVDAHATAPPPAARGWRYAAADKRDLRLDLLRGFAVFAMVVDHVGGISWLHLLTGGNRFFVSAAEGFVFISGVTVGIVYGARARRDGLREGVKKLLNRSWTLYALAVWLALATAAAAALFDLPRGVIPAENPARFIVEVLTLQRTFYLVDVMLFYAGAMVVAPLALWALLRRRWWLVAAVSIALWGAYQFAPGAAQLPWRIIDNPVFNFAPWQLLFFGGMILGYLRERPAPLPGARRLPRPLRELALPLLAALLGVLIYLHATNAIILAPYVPGGDTAAWLDRWFDKGALPFPRLAACALVFAFAWALVSRCWRPLQRALGWLLLPLGQGALYAYAAHLFLVIGVQILVAQVWARGSEAGYSTRHMGLDTLLQLGVILLLWGLTRVRFLQAIVAPLGTPPLKSWTFPRLGRVVPRPSDSLAALAVVALLCAPFLIQGGVGGGIILRSRTGSVAPPNAAPGGGPGIAAGATGGAAAAPSVRPNPASTVTAPRSVAGGVRGSSGLTGRNDAPGASAAPGAAPRATARPAASAVPAPAAGVAPTIAPSGGYLQDAAFYSEALGRTMPYGVYLPPTYDSDPNRRYPVVYMLHGAGGHYSEWVAYGLPETTENLIWDGQIQPLIIVMPQGDHSYFVNHIGTDEQRWGDYVAFDLVGHIDASYRTLPQATSRAIGGLSMGGFGALQLALTNPAIFGAVGGHSPALRTIDQLADLIVAPDAERRFDPVELVETIDPTYAPRIWVDSGSDDIWAGRVALLGRDLDARGIAHEVRLLPGHHDSDYWTEHTGDYVRFYSRSLVGGAPGVGARQAEPPRPQATTFSGARSDRR